MTVLDPQHDGGTRSVVAAAAAPSGLPAAEAVGGEYVAGSQAGVVQSPPTLRKGYVAALLLGYGTLYLAWIAPTAFSLAIRVQQIDPSAKDAALAVAIGLPGILVLLTGPLVGVLSDRTRSRWGRRRPWFLGGTVLGFAGTAVVALAPSVPLLVLGWTIAFVGYTAAGGMVLTHLSDRLPEEQRGRIAGLTGSVTQVMPVFGIVLAGSLLVSPVAMFVVPAAIALVGGVVFGILMKDAPDIEPKERIELAAVLRGFWFAPRRLPNLGWVWLSRALIFAALSLYSLYTVYLLAAKLALEAGAIAALIATVGGAGVLATVAGALVGGFLSDRLRNRKLFLVLGSLLLAAGLSAIATTESVLQYVVGAVLAAIAIGMYAAVDQATFLDVIPAEEGQNGRYLGIINLANQIPQAIGPFVAGALVVLVGGDYTWVYLLAGAFAVAGALAILPLRIPRGRAGAAEDARAAVAA
jgi:MFS family permease